MVIDVTDATFDAEVLQRSMTTPVVVDLWAPWCGPCKTLGPILERVVSAANGKVVLAKINVDENPQASAAFQVQSIPAVYALDQGQVVANFMGAQPEAEIRAFVSNLIGGELGAADALPDPHDEAALRQALELASGSESAPGGEATNGSASVQVRLMLGQLLFDQERFGEAIEVLDGGHDDDPQITSLLELARAAVLPADIKTGVESQLAELLPKVKRDDDARSSFVDLLGQLSAGDPAAAAVWRKKLSTQLF